MSDILFGARKQPVFGGRQRGNAAAEPNPDKPLDAVWIVLEAANDLGDHATIEVCRRVIDANLNGAAVSPYDLDIITEYFR